MFAFIALPPSISVNACCSAVSYASWKRGARRSFTWSCTIEMCESDEIRGGGLMGSLLDTS